jgi:MoaA/NifB/PqqE/SkfB family radical SAM enzyme
VNDCSDLLYPPNLIFQLSRTQIISGAIGSDFDSSWQLPEIQAQVKEIGVHETEIFKVIVMKNGRRMTITPALSRSAKEAHDIYLERVRQANLLGQAGKQMRTSYKCPFMMANCNGQSMRCARCKPLLGEYVKEQKPKWPTCPFATATCTRESWACAKCKKQADKR